MMVQADLYTQPTFYTLQLQVTRHNSTEWNHVDHNGRYFVEAKGPPLTYLGKYSLSPSSSWNEGIVLQ